MSLREHTNHGQTIDLYAIRARSKVHPATFMLESKVKAARKAKEQAVELTGDELVTLLHNRAQKGFDKLLKEQPKSKDNKDLGGGLPKYLNPQRGRG